MSARPEAGVVTISALDLRRRPDHRSEMRSQLLLGEVVRVLGTAAGGWWRVENRADGYTGWVRSWGLVPAGTARARRWLRRATARITAPVVSLEAVPGGGTGVGPLFLNCRAIPGRRGRGFQELELPDGRRGWVPGAAIAGARWPAELEDRVRSLLGTPYLWGGRTPAGFDCSAYVQQVMAERGIRLPRDAWQQRAACRPLRKGERLVSGDLLFFGLPRRRVSHVGLALGGAWFTDCRGRVRMVSHEADKPLYDSTLMEQFRGAGRPV